MKKEAIISRSEQDTYELGEKLGRSAEKGSIFALSGELGTGKTVIAKGIARGIGVSEEIISPSYLKLEIYKGKFDFFHFDLYRFRDQDELDELGFEEYWESDGVSVIEWPEKAEGRIPLFAIKIYFEWISATERRITIEYPGD